jgi:tetratricopeptide (TPR) repeat protein
MIVRSVFHLWFIAVALLCGCVFQKPAEDYAVGRRGGEVFIQKPELLVAGLVDDALNLYKKGRRFDAEQRLRQARFIAPESEKVLFNLAVVIGETDQADESIEILSRLIEKFPGNVEYKIALGHSLYADRRGAQAIDTYKEAFRLLKSVKNFARAQSLARTISSIAYELGREQEALCYSSEAYFLQPNPEEAFYHGRMLLSVNSLDAVVRFMKLAETADPSLKTKVGPNYVVGLAQYGLGQEKDGYDRMNVAVDVLSGDPILSAEVSAAWYIMRPDKTAEPRPQGEGNADQGTTEELSEKELEELKKIREAATEFARSNPRALQFWPPAVSARLLLLAEQAEEPD